MKSVLVAVLFSVSALATAGVVITRDSEGNTGSCVIPGGVMICR